ncbi:MAG TPA: hypothetical protein VEF90_13550, partial [Xanthobacteraceae bacterium]|nr:hypothetical protein [Xanthobacteraceae bacterium]
MILDCSGAAPQFAALRDSRGNSPLLLRPSIHCATQDFVKIADISSTVPRRRVFLVLFLCLGCFHSFYLLNLLYIFGARRRRPENTEAASSSPAACRFAPAAGGRTNYSERQVKFLAYVYSRES